VRRLVLARSSSLLELGLRRVAASAVALRLRRGVALAVALFAAAVAPRPGEAQLRIVATLPDLYVLTRAVAGTAATVDLVARFGQNPHDIEVRPSHMLLVRRADVLVRNGLEEDSWIDVIVRGSNNPKAQRGSPHVIDASLGVEILKVPTGRVDRSLGDVHATGNPHYTLDPANLPIVTRNIAAGLARVAPEHSRPFEANREALLEKVAEADRRWKALLAPFRGARIVSHHDSWPYMFRAFGFVEGGLVEDRPGIPPSPQHLAGLVRRMRDERARVILLENWYAPDAANLVARETGAKVLAVPQTPGAVKGTDDYVAHLDYILTAIADALR
jgi:zinc/manganese transport system substrate-binding protein